MPQYSKSPLIEVLCEFHFSPGPAWEDVFVGLIYEKVRHAYPIRKAVRTVSVNLTPVALADITAIKRSQFCRSDEKALIQIGEHFLAVNHLRPYPTWREYFPMAQQALSVYTEIAAPKSVSRIALRYINRFDSLNAFA
jgi:uncharacterized protein (TIGR04255 family)